MPELPDVTIYQERLSARCVGRPLRRVRLGSPFLLRTVLPPLEAFQDRELLSVERLGKRLVLGLSEEHFLVIHLMIAGRLRWARAGASVRDRRAVAAFDFDHGTVRMTEASKRKRASLHAVQGRAALQAFDRGGLDVRRAGLEELATRLRQENHTLKRSLTDPRIIDGIGNAYSDEILHRAQLSPVVWTRRLSDEEIARLYTATREVLQRFTDRLREEVGEGFPDKVSAFRPDMAVHGRYRKPCPVCHDPVQRIVYANNETNYCATCQNEGRLLKDRALSRLLKSDWPRTLTELEELRAGGGA